MTRHARTRPARLLALAVAAVGTWNADRASAATQYWDVNGATPGAASSGTATGTWDAATANWSLDPAGAASTSTWTGGNLAIFSAGSDATGTYTVTVTGTQLAGGLTLEEGNLTLAGGSLNFNQSSNVIDTQANTLTITSSLTGTGTITKTGPGLLSLSGGGTVGSFTVAGGSVNQTAGTLTDSGELDIAPAPGISATYSITTGLSNASSLYVGGTSSSPGGAGTLAISGGAVAVSGPLKIYNIPGNTVNVSGGSLAVGSLDTSGNPSLLNWTAGTLAITGGSVFSIEPTQPLGSNLTIAPNMTFNVTGNRNEIVGNTAAGAITQTGGTHNVGGPGFGLFLGGAPGGTGSYTISGGILSASAIHVGENGSGTFLQTGGTVTTTRSFWVANSAGTSGLYTLAGGLLDLQTDGTQQIFGVGSGTNPTGGVGTLNVTGGTLTSARQLTVGRATGSAGTFNQSGGVVSLNAGALISLFGGSTGTYNLSGGSLSATSITVGGSSGGTGVFALSGSAVASVTGALKIWHTAGTTVDLAGGALSVGSLNTSGNPSLFNWTAGGLTFTNSDLVLDPGAEPFGASLTLAAGKSLSLTGTFSETVGLSGAGTLTQSGGSNSAYALTLGAGPLASGLYTLSGGAASFGAGGVTVGNNSAGAPASSLSITNATLTDSGPLTVNKSGNVLLNGGSLSYGSVLVDGGTMTWTAGAVTGSPVFVKSGGKFATAANWGLTFGGASGVTDPGSQFTLGASSTLSLFDFAGAGNNFQVLNGGALAVPTLNVGSGTLVGTLLLAGAGSSITTTNEYVGNTGPGTLNQTGGSNTAFSLTVGDAAAGTGFYTLSGGSLSVGQHEMIGNTGTGVFTHSAGTNAVTSELNLGRNIGGTGTYSLSGTGVVTAANLTSGYQGVGSFDQSAGSLVVANYLNVGLSSTGIGSYKLSGGQVTAWQEIVGESGSGTFLQTGGTNSVTNYALWLGQLTGGTGTYNLSAGSLTAAQHEMIGATGSGTFTQTGGSNAVGQELDLGRNTGGRGVYNLGPTAVLSSNSLNVGWSGTGTFLQTGGTNTAVAINVGNASGGTGFYSLSAGSVTASAGDLRVANGSGSVGTFLQSGGAVSVPNTNFSLILGFSSGSTGNYNLTGGALNIGTAHLGLNGTGTLTQSGGTFTASQAIFIGTQGLGSGTFIQTGGRVVIPTGGNAISVGQGAGGSGYYDLSGAAFVSVPQFYVGNTGSGTLTQSGGTLAVSNQLYLGGSVGGSGLYSMTGGSLSTPSAWVGGRSAGPSGTGQLSISGSAAATVTGTLRVYNTPGTSVTLSGGSLSVGSLELYNPFIWTGGSFSAGSVNIFAGGTFSGATTAGSPFVVNSGGYLAPGPGVASFSVPALTLNTGSFLDLDLGTASDLVSVTTPGALNLAGGSLNLSAAPGFGPGTYTLLDYTGWLGGSLASLSIARGVPGYTYALVNNPGNTSVDLVVTAASGASWAADASGNWFAPGNWTATPPDAPDALATFGPVTTAARTVTLDAPVTIGSVSLSGPSPYTLAGPGPLTFSASTHALLSAAGASGSLVSTPVVLAVPTDVVATAATDSLTLSGVVSGPGSLNVSGAGTVLLSADNTFAGGTSVAPGATLRLGAGGTAGSVAGDLADNGTVILNRSDDFTYAGSVSGSGTLQKLGTGTLTLTGSSSFNGSASLAGPVVFNPAAPLATFAGSISAASSLTKTGTGRLVLSGSSSYTGTTTINAGTIIATASTSLGALPVSAGNDVIIADGASLDITSTALNGLNFGQKVFHIAGDGGGLGALTNRTIAEPSVAGLSQQNSLQRVILDADASIGGPGSGPDVLNTYDGRLDIRVGTFGNGVLNLNGHTLTKFGDSLFGLVNIDVQGAGDIVVNGGAGAFNVEAATHLLASGSSKVLVHDGAMFQLWNTPAGSTNITRPIVLGDGIPSSNTFFAAGSGATDLIGSPITLMSDLTVRPSYASFSNANVTLTGNISQDSLPRKIVKTNTGIFALAGTNTFTGGVEINPGANPNTGTSGTGVVQLAGPAGLAPANVISFGPAANFTATFRLSGNSVTVAGLRTTASAGASVVENASATPATLTVNNATDHSFAGVIQNGTGGGILSLTKSGPGTLTLAGANAYTGPTTVSAGTLALSGSASATPSVSVAAGATLLWDNTTTVSNARLGNSATIALAGGQFNFAGAGTLSNVISGSGSITKSSPGVLTLNATNTFAGSAFLTAGALRLAKGAALPTSTAFTMSPGTTLEIANVATTSFPATANDATVIRGTGTAVKAGSTSFATSGTMTLDVPAPADSLRFTAALRNAGAGGGQTSSATIALTGAGLVRLNSGATGTLASGTQFSGNWLVQMDNATGVLALGPIVNGAVGEPLNALGYRAPATDFAIGYDGVTSPITVAAGTLALGADAPNARNNPTLTSTSFRSPLTLAGGRVSSTSFEYNPDTGDPTSSIPVTANLGASLTLAANTSSAVLLYDPLLGSAGGARSVNVVTDPAAITPGVGPVPTDITWETGSTLVVSPGATTGGSLNFKRTTGATHVSPGATLSILPGAIVSLTGSVDPLSDANHAVYLLNSGTLSVGPAATASVSSLTGGGRVQFNGTAGTLTAGLDDASSVFSGSLTGSGSLLKKGAGALQLTGDNSSFTGSITLQQGLLLAGSDANLGAPTTTLNLSTGTFRPAGSFNLSHPVNVSSSATLDTPVDTELSLTGPVTATGPLTKTGAGALRLAGTGAVSSATVSDGSLILSSAAILPSTAIVSLSAAATLDTAGQSHTLAAVTGPGSVLLSSGNTLTLGSADTSSTLSASLGGDGSLTKIGLGTLTLSGASTYTRTTTVSAGTLRLGSDTALPASTTLTLAAGATLDTPGGTHTLAALAGAGSVTNSTPANAATLVLSSSLTDDNTFTGSLTGNLSLLKSGPGFQTLAGANSFTGALTVTAGTLALTNANTFSGPVTVQPAGTLAVSSDAALGLASNPISLAGGRLLASTTLSTSRTLALAADSTLDVAPSSTLTFSGHLTSTGALTKSGSGTLLITSATNLASLLNLSAGTVRLAGSSGSIASSSVTLGVATSLIADNTTTYNADRLSDTGSVILRGGTFSYLGANNTASIESLGQLIPQSGGSTVSLTNGTNGTTTVTFSSLGTRGQSATVNFAAPDLGNTNKVLFTTPPPVVAADPAVGNVGAWATVNGSDWAKYSLASGIIPFAPTDYANDLLLPTTHVRLTASQSGLGDLTVRTLNLATSATPVDLTQSPGTTLTLSQGGLLHSGTASSTISGGSIRSSTATLNVYTSGGDLRLAGVVSESLPESDLVKAGPGTLYLGEGSSDITPNTYTGTTRVQGGTLVLDKAANTFAIPGPLEISGGTLIVNRPGQINPTATVSLTGGTFDLNGRTETFTTLTNDGGTFLFNGGTLNVQGIELRGGTTIVASELVAGSFLTISGGDNQIHPSGLVTVNGTTTFTGDSGPALTIYAGPAPGRLTLAGNLAFDGADGTAVISSTTPGASETPGTLDLGSSPRTFTINDGAAATDMRISARIIGSASLTKAGAGLLKLSSPNTYSGGTLLSEGTLEAADPASLGTGPVTFSSTATLLFRSDAPSATFPNPITVSTSTRDVSLQIERTSNGTTGTFTTGRLTLGKSLTLAGSTGGTLLVPGSVTLQNNITINNSVTLDLEGPVTGGAFNLTKTLAGALILGGSSPNTYTGTTTINAGLLQLQKTPGATAVPGPLTVNGPATVRLMNSNQIADYSIVTLNATKGQALLDLSGSSDTLASLSFVAGGTVNTGLGTLTLTSDSSFTGTSGSALITGKLALGGSGPRTFTVADSSAATDLEIAAVISGSQGFIKAGAGRLVLSGANTFTGGIAVTGGVLFITSDAALNGNPVSLNGGVLISSGSLSAPLNVDSATTMDVPDNLVLTGALSGSGTFIKSGTGTLTLAAPGTFTGPINVTGGTLAVPSAAALGTTSPVTLSNATFRATSALSTARPFVTAGSSATLDLPAGQTLSLTGSVSGTAPLTKTGPGSLSFAGPVTTSSLTTLSQGTTSLDSPQTFPGGLAVAAGATLSVTSTSSVTGPFSTGAGVTLNHNATTFSLTGTGNTSFSGNLRLTGSLAGAVAFARTGGTSTISPGSSLQIDPGASLSLSGPAPVFTPATSLMSINNDSLLNVSAGNSTLASLLGTGSTTITGGSLTTPSLRQSSLTLTGGKLTLQPTPTPNSVTALLSTLSITGPGIVDLANCSLVLDYASVSPLASLRNYLFAGRGPTGSWDGPGGIDSASAGADPNHSTALAYIEASTLLGLTDSQTALWNGIPVDATSLLVKFTYYGDANLDGRLTPDDFALLDRGRARTPSSAEWFQGDYNYDNQVTAADYLLADSALIHQTGILSPSLLAQRESQFGPQYVSALLISIPEPATPLTLTALTLPLLTRRRR